MDENVFGAHTVDVHDIRLDEAAFREHVIRPANIEGVVSSRGPEEGTARAAAKVVPIPGSYLHLKGFADALHATLRNSVAGYVMQLRRNGKTVLTLQWQWAKTPADGSQGWTPNVRMHVASCSKLITGMAMTKLLNDKSLSYDTPIIGSLPTYWAKGPNVNKITFRHLLTQRSGLNFGVKSSDSDYGFMKSQVAAGVTHLGEYWYQNMNFGLCRILIATLNGNIAPSASATDVFWDFVMYEAVWTV